MTHHAFASLALLALAGSPPPPTPAKVASITLEDLIRFSDAVVVGRVARLEVVHRPSNDLGWAAEPSRRLGAEIPFAEVEVLEVLKGAPDLRRLIYLAAPTWTCDITSAELGETALLFLGDASQSELFDGGLRRRVRASFPDGAWMEVMWSGRGRMPLWSVGDAQHAVYWTDVRLPESSPSVAGPEPKDWQIIRSVPLAWVEEKVRTCLVEQREPWLRASVSEVGDGSLPWDLDLTLDGQARLVIHDPRGDRERRFRLSSSRLVGLSYGLRDVQRCSPADAIGSRIPDEGVRSLQVVPPEPPLDLRIRSIDAHSIDSDDRKAIVRLALEVWDQIRGSFDEPRCADHREADRRWRSDDR
jgi:hypothetical protein